MREFLVQMARATLGIGRVLGTDCGFAALSPHSLEPAGEAHPSGLAGEQN